jgi:predicted DNA-binding protein
MYGIWRNLRVEKTTVYLDQESQRVPLVLSKRSGRPQAELIREALALYLERKEDLGTASWVGSWTGGP